LQRTIENLFFPDPENMRVGSTPTSGNLPPYFSAFFLCWELQDSTPFDSGHAEC